MHMETHRGLTLHVVKIVGVLWLVSRAIAAEAGEDAAANLQRAVRSDPKAAKELADLQQTIEQLHAERAQLEKDRSAGEVQQQELAKQNAELKESKRHLERNQSRLAGGLIGAVIAALVSMI